MSKYPEDNNMNVTSGRSFMVADVPAVDDSVLLECSGLVLDNTMMNVTVGRSFMVVGMPAVDGSVLLECSGLVSDMPLVSRCVPEPGRLHVVLLCEPAEAPAAQDSAGSQ